MSATRCYISLLTRYVALSGQLLVTEFFFEVPLDYSGTAYDDAASSAASGFPRTIRLFGRAAIKYEVPAGVTPAEVTPEQQFAACRQPWLVYLEGGPGYGNREPQDMSLTRYAINRGYRVLYLDYRGTGLSTPIDAAHVEALGPPEVQARYLRYFRQDNIVRDLEAVRLYLTQGPATSAESSNARLQWEESSDDGTYGDSDSSKPDYQAGTAAPFAPERRWTLFGQSFGGFVALTYLSFYPAALVEVFLTGGLAPVTVRDGPDKVYAATYRKLLQRNAAYWRKYPEDDETLRRLAAYLDSQGKKTTAAKSADGSSGREGQASDDGWGGVPLPSGGRLTMPRFMTAGISFGSHGGLDAVHSLVLRVRSDLEQFGYLTRGTLVAIENGTPTFDTNPIYAILHEAIYCDGPGVVSDWSAWRVGRTLPEFAWFERPDFFLQTDAHRQPEETPSSSSSSDARPKGADEDDNESANQFTVPHRPHRHGSSTKQLPRLYFTGEMVYPFHFTSGTHPELTRLQAAAELLARESNWPPLYDLTQLSERNSVPVYAASFVEDMYVDFDLARETARAVRGCKVMETNGMYHNAIRARPDEVLRELFRLRDDPID